MEVVIEDEGGILQIEALGQHIGRHENVDRILDGASDLVGDGFETAEEQVAHGEMGAFGLVQKGSDRIGQVGFPVVK